MEFRADGLSRLCRPTPNAATGGVDPSAAILDYGKRQPGAERVEWIHGDTVTVGNRFRGHNSNPARGQWTTESLVVEVEEGRRWVWDVQGDGGQPMASWGFEVEPDRGGTLVRQWGRMGPGRSRLSEVIDQMPEKEARIIDRRLAGWREGMRANLRAIAEICAAESDSA